MRPLRSIPHSNLGGLIIVLNGFGVSPHVW